MEVNGLFTWIDRSFSTVITSFGLYKWLVNHLSHCAPRVPSSHHHIISAYQVHLACSNSQWGSLASPQSSQLSVPLLSGLNAATVGIIALAGVKLARKTITGPLTRLLLVGTGCAGICYNALWYFPVILIIDGMITLSWALWHSSAVRMKIIEWRSRRMCRRVSEDPHKM